MSTIGYNFDEPERLTLDEASMRIRKAGEILGSVRFFLQTQGDWGDKLSDELFKANDILTGVELEISQKNRELTRLRFTR